MKGIQTNFKIDSINDALSDTIKGTVTVLSVTVSHLPEDDKHSSEMAVHATVAGAVENLESAINKQKFRCRDKIYYSEIDRLVSNFFKSADSESMSSSQPVAYVAITSRAEDKKVMSNRKLIFCTLEREVGGADD